MSEYSDPAARVIEVMTEIGDAYRELYTNRGVRLDGRLDLDLPIFGRIMGLAARLRAALNEIRENLVSGLKSQHVVVGPLVWRQSDGTTTKDEYFVIVRFTEEVDFIKMAVGEQIAEARIARRQLIATLVAHHPPLDIHDMEDELGMAALCEALWPCEKTSLIRSGVETEWAERRRRRLVNRDRKKET
jgi:hypothetical protein